MRTLAREIDGMELPAIEKLSEEHKEDPFQILIGTLLSARTQDATTHAAVDAALSRRAHAEDDGASCRSKQIEKLIYPVSFYRNKARFVKATCEALVERFGGKVPGTLDELVTLPGVGRKTANLVMILGVPQPREHLRRHARPPHLQSHGLGPDARSATRPNRRCIARPSRRWWPSSICIFVTWGQNVCRPVYPRCGACALADGMSEDWRDREAASRAEAASCRTDAPNDRLESVSSCNLRLFHRSVSSQERLMRLVRLRVRWPF